MALELGELKQNKFGEVYFENVNKLSFEKTSAKSVFDKEFNALFDEKETLYLIMGTDSGNLLNYVEEKFQEDVAGRKFIFFEYKGLLDQFSEIKLPRWIEIYSIDFSTDRYVTDIQDILQQHYPYLLSSKTKLLKSLCVLDAKLETSYKTLEIKISQAV
ncbi:MAG TPA: hypothetical protein ENK75_03345, partial [Saprospiraceae bacterium]|nr:hypothetical protein [Saprospiraceae bacterium]